VSLAAGSIAAKFAGSFATVRGLKLSSWPGETSAAAFSPVNARTHLVNELGAAILAAAQPAPLTAQDLCDAVFDDDDEPILEVDVDVDVDVDVGVGPHPSDAAVQDPALAAVCNAIDGLVQAGLLRQVETS